MKSFFPSMVIVLTLTVSCADTPAQQISYGDYRALPALRVQYPTRLDSSKNIEWQHENLKVNKSSDLNIDTSVMHAVLNSQTGRPFWYLPLPENWKVVSRGTSAQTTIVGPNDLLISALNSQSFAYSDNEDLNRAYRESNFQVKKPMPIDSIFSELLVPSGHKMGLTLLKHYPLSEVASNNMAYSRQFSTSTPQDIEKVEGSDWTDDEGNKVFVVLYYTELKMGGILNWGYYLEMLKAKPTYLEQAKKQFIYSISNKKFSQSEIDIYNDSIAKKEANERYIRYYNTDLYKDCTGRLVRHKPDFLDYSSIDIPDSSSLLHGRTSEELRNDSVNVCEVINPFDRGEYLVGSGFQIYWINENSYYIQSNDTLFDPNSFESQPGVWQKAVLKEDK